MSLTTITGEVLRDVRLARGLSLRQVTVRSGGRFKPSSVASYERGERHISLERLFDLASVYDTTPERIVSAIAQRMGSTRDRSESGRSTPAAGGPRGAVAANARTLHTNAQTPRR